jgi:two-component system LytT family sensor kinase
LPGGATAPPRPAPAGLSAGGQPAQVFFIAPRRRSSRKDGGSSHARVSRLNRARSRRMNAPAMHNRWIRYAVVVAGWAFLGCLLSLELYFNYRAGMSGKPGHDPDLFDVAMPQFVRATMWALLAPLILQLREKMPLRRGGWAGGIGFHLGMSFVVMATYYLGRIFAYMLFFEKFSEGFWEHALGGFYGRNLIDMAFYWGVLAFGHGLELHQRYKHGELKAAQLEARLVEAELKVLREQLHPHFFFNTLNAIAVLVREEKPAEAVTLIARLSSLLRLSLDRTRLHEVTLREELEFLACYLDIQKARFSDRLEVGIAIEPAALEARIPNLLLQPLVENAILHGVAPKSGPGRVDVIGRIADGRLHLEVRDDGPGLRDDGTPPKEGVGLSNTRERLAKIYGDRGELWLRNAPGRGLTVLISLPCRT